MGYLQDYNQQNGSKTSNITPSVGGFLQQYESTKKPEVKKVTKTITPTKKLEPLIPKKTPTPFADIQKTARNIVKNISDTIKFKFTAPSLSPRLPDSAFPSSPVAPQKPIAIKPGATKIDLNQIKQVAGNFIGKTVNKIANAEQSVFGIKLGTIGKNLSELGKILSGNTLPGMAEEYDKLDPWSKLNEASKIMGMLPTMQGFKQIEGAKDAMSAIRGFIGGYGAGSVLKFAAQEPKKRSIGEAIKPSFDNLVFAYFTGSTGLPNPFEFLKKQPKISQGEYIKARDFLKDLGVKEDVFSKPDALKKSYFELAKKEYAIDPSGNSKLMKKINNAYKTVKDSYYDIPKTGDKQPIAGLLTDGEYTPQEVIGKVIKAGEEKTTVGKEVIKAALEAQKNGQNIIVKTGKPTDIKEIIKTKETQIITQDIPGIEKAGQYTSAKDFADITYSAKPTDQIGKLSSDLIIARDSTNEEGVQQYVDKIKAGESIDPVEVTKQGDKFITTDGSHRVTAYKLLSMPIPVIYRGEGKIAGLKTFEEIYKIARPTPPLSPTKEVLPIQPQKSDLEQTKGESRGVERIPSNIEAQIPVGEGKLKKSKAYTRIKDRLSEEAQLDVSYNILNLEQDTQNAMNFIIEDPKKAIRVALGLESPPKGQTETAISIALADKAGREKNYLLESQLEASRSLRQTRRGQEIVSERGRFSENSPHYFIKRLMDTRLTNLGKNLKSALAEGKTLKKIAIEKIDKGVTRLKEKLQVDRKKIQLAQDIIDSLRC